MSIHFFTDGVKAKIPHRKKLIELIKLIGLVEEIHFREINIILVTDERLLEINQKYLNHNFYTDIITFQSATLPDSISGELYISWDRVAENAKDLKVDLVNELSRVIVHGVLHLCGYRDKQAVEKKLMRKKEDFYLKSLETL